MQLLVQQLSPVTSAHGYGIEMLETGSYVLHAFRAETGVQFFVTADLKTEHLMEFLVRSVVFPPRPREQLQITNSFCWMFSQREVYTIYSDYVMKNPFYELDMPIKVDLWENHLRELVSKHSARLL